MSFLKLMLITYCRKINTQKYFSETQQPYNDYKGEPPCTFTCQPLPNSTSGLVLSPPPTLPSRRSTLKHRIEKGPLLVVENGN